MTLLEKKLKLVSPKVLIFTLFLFLHAVLFGVNVAEWGDSYRILRAAEYVRRLSYPTDEKRPPLFSAILALRPGGVDQVFWGRVVMLIFSILAFFVFDKLCDLFFKKGSKGKTLALLLFALNPVYLYWSIRIMADVPFSLIVLAVFYLYTKKKEMLRIRDVVILGILCALGVMTRFEGYVLFGALGLGLLLESGLKPFRLFPILKKQFSKILTFIFSFLIILAPYFYFRNPFGSKYFSEPATRTYDLKTVVTYLVSLLFLFGFTSAFYFLFKKKNAVLSFFKSNIAIAAFVLVELLVILAWPAAVPRLFVPIIPLLIIPLAMSISVDSVSLVGSGLLLLVFVLSQYFLRLQFLVPVKTAFILVTILQVVLAFALVLKNNKVFVVTLVLSMFIWSLASIWLHKDIFAAVQAAASYASNNLEGVVGYNDVSSVSDWYLNQKGVNNVTGVYFPYSKKEQLDYDNLLEDGFDYILLTNEHNTDTTLDIEKRPYLEEIKEFRKVINGQEFWTKVVRIKHLL